MSNVIQPISTCRSVDPKVDLNEQKRYIVRSGGESLTYQTFPSQGTSSDNQTITIQVPNVSTITNRYILIKHYVQYDFTGTGSGPLLQLGVNDGIKSFPVMGNVSALNLRVGNSTVSIQPNEILQPMARFWDRKLRKACMSTTPNAMDTYQDYNDWINWFRTPGVGAGGERNVLGVWGQGEDNRGSFGGYVYSTLSNTNTTASVQIVDTSPLFISPLLLSSDCGAGLVGANTLQIVLTYGNLNAGWAHSSGGNTLSTVRASFYRAPEILTMFITPNQIDKYQIYDMARFYMWPYMDMGEIQQTASQSVVSDATANFSLSSFAINSIPNKLIVYVRRQISDRSFSTTDSYARIESLNITVNNISNILSGASVQDLYNISAKNGLDMDWTQYNAFSSGPLSLKFGDDIYLRPDQAPGLLTQTTISIQCTARNISGSSVNYVLYCIPMQEGIFQCDRGNFSHDIGVLSKQDVIVAQQLPKLTFSSDNTDMVGGNFWDSFKSGFNSVWNSALSGVKDIASAIEPITKIYKTVTGKGLSGGARVKKGMLKSSMKHKGKKLRGGSAVTLSMEELKRSLREDSDEESSD